MPLNIVVCWGGVTISVREVYAHKIGMPIRCTPTMGYTREMQHGIHVHSMHAREIYTRKYMLMGCTPEITALIFPKVYLTQF
jgi:hypothetical protein